MTRNALARPICAATLIAAASGLLAACGGNDSTASSTPSSAGATSVTASANPSSGAPNGGQNSAPAPTSPGAAATAPPETPQAVPSGFPGPTEVPARTSRDKEFLEALKKAGVDVSGNGQSAIDIANYICAASQANSPQQQINVNVTAMAGVEANLTGSQMNPQDAAQVYIDTARKHYCK
ncbi:DUF732 domain-containing protein [Skermania sp. ID1734]|uniref:DUF732 domain-containing protein n=1 Tax=Skermania sp. ID1734 TaxID=2597516 RepID=UPI00117F4499|nr:DUF732 domain-containing protein [Skermania sp. ID1734]TSE00742.1 DUF732 domain-containing protein [Skermania sp. ID1734]